jgi:hypothetical protein
MKPLSNRELLQVWEQGLAQQPIQQALLLLAAAYPELSPQELAELSLGQRDSYLLTLRAGLFGSRLSGQATCPQCQEAVELKFDTADIQLRPDHQETMPLLVTTAGYEVRFRLPNSLDLLAVAGQAETGTGQDLLLNQCILAIEGEVREVRHLPAPVVTAIIETMAQADPQADIELALICPACAYAWPVTFDIITYLWEEITAWAYRTLHAVHQLASAYGWSETDILALSPWKRYFYLQLVNG